MDRVLVIDSEESRCDVVDGLRCLGFQVYEEANSENALRRVQEDPHYVLVVSESMPPVSSTDLLMALREITEGPMVVLGSGRETAMVEALMRGADFYLERPVKTKELAARLRALLRRCHKNNGGNGHLDALDGNTQLGKLFENLSQTEAKLLRFLLERDGELTGREELMAGVWGESGKDTSLRFYIWQLRRKLNGAGRVEIMNMKGMGYLLKVHPAN
jgi:DNA-binding response OmpR family regulator